jgi:hypothetical protein
MIRVSGGGMFYDTREMTPCSHTEENRVTKDEEKF